MRKASACRGRADNAGGDVKKWLDKWNDFNHYATMNPVEIDYFEFTKGLAQDMRHTANVVWRLSIAIVTLQGSAITGCVLILNAQRVPQPILGWSILIAGFFVSVLFSLMLVRQAEERVGLALNNEAAQKKLRVNYADVFKETKHIVPAINSIHFAWCIVAETVVGLLVVLFLVFARPSATGTAPTANAMTVQIASGETFSYPLQSNKNVRIEVEAGRFTFFSTTN